MFWEGFAVLGVRVRNVAADVSVAIEVGALLPRSRRSNCVQSGPERMRGIEPESVGSCGVTGT